VTINGFGYNLLYADFDIVDCADRVLQSIGYQPMTAKEKSLAIYVCRGETMLDAVQFCLNYAPLTSLFAARPIYECEVMAAFLRAPPFIPNFGTLWATANNLVNRDVCGFTVSQATTAGQFTAPATTLTLPDIGLGTTKTILSIAISPAGDLWAAYAAQAGTTTQVIAKFAASKLAAGGPVTADIVLTGPTGSGFNAISALTFRADGSLWCSTSGGPVSGDNVFGYAASQLLTTGTPTPIAIVRSGTWFFVDGMAFDSTGNLWVPSFGGTTLSKLTPAQLTADNLAIIPAVVLNVAAGVACLTLDADGNLWTANYTTGVVLMYAAADIQVSGAPTPQRVLSLGLNKGIRIAFDGNQNLWIAEQGGHRVSGYSPGALAVSGSPPPNRTITGAGALVAPVSIAFGPVLGP
jgi:hypothetical protein